MSKKNANLEKSLKKWALVCAISTIALSAIILTGWAVGSENLQSLFPTEALKAGTPHIGTVGPTAAICMLLLATSLLIEMFSSNSRTYTAITAKVLEFTTLAIGVLNLIDNLANKKLQILTSFSAGTSTSGISFPYPMLLQTSIAIILLSLAMILYNKKYKNSYPFQLISLFYMFCAVVVLMGATTKVQVLCTVGRCFTPSIAYSFIAMSFACGIFLSKPGIGISTTYASDSVGGVLLRRLTFLLTIPCIYLCTKILNYIVVGGQPILNLDSCNTIASGISILFIVYLFWSGAQVANKTETELKNKSEAFEKLRETRAQLLTGDEDAPIASLKYKKVCLTCTCEYEDSAEYCPNDGSKLSRVIDSSLLGTIFADRYKILKELGSGAMSTVYRAQHTVLGKEVAIKVLNSATLISSDGLRRFKREAESIGKLDHPNIVGTSDFGLSQDGRPYLIMDYIEGETLTELLERTGRLQLPKFITITEQLLNGLQHAHEQGFVHRDLKPGNIMIEKNVPLEFGVKIVDFGLAKAIEDDTQDLTLTGETLGSPLYMSPEQCKGEKTDQRSDLYSLGCILFECLAGHQPIIGKNIADTFKMHVEDKPAPFPNDCNVPPPIMLLIYKIISKERNERPQSAKELRELLHTALKEAKV